MTIRKIIIIMLGVVLIIRKDRGAKKKMKVLGKYNAIILY